MTTASLWVWLKNVQPHLLVSPGAWRTGLQGQPDFPGGLAPALRPEPRERAQHWAQVTSLI